MHLSGRRPGAWRFTIVAGGLATALLYAAGLSLLGAATPESGASEEALRTRLAALGLVAGALFLFFQAGLRGRPSPPRSLVLILVAGALVRVWLLAIPVVLETDHYRYLWDGAVVAHGLDPYRFSPQQVLLGEAGVPHEMRGLAVEADVVLRRVNHPGLTTIYPPVAQAAFAAAHLLRPYDVPAWRALLFAADLAAAALLLLLLRAARLPAVCVGLYWLNPVLLREIYAAAHLDLLGVPLVLAALAMLVRRRPLASAALLAVATGVKPWPVVLLPLLLRHADGVRGAVAAALAFGAVGLVVWAPMLPAGFAADSGWEAYAAGWQVNAGAFGVLVALLERLALPTDSWNAALAARMLVAGLLLVVTLRLSRRRIADARDLLVRAGTIVGAVFLLIPTPFPWYYTWVLPFLVFRPLGALAAYSALLPLYYVQHRSPWILGLEHGPVWMALGAAWWQWRREGSPVTAVSREFA